MKKVLILMLVFGMTSLAGAALNFNISTTDPDCTIDGLIESPVTIYMFIASDAAITISKGDAAPSMAGYSYTVAQLRGYGLAIPTMYSYGEAWVMAAPPLEDYQTGTYLTGVGAAGDSVLGGWFDESMNYGEYGSGTLVPEPMTIALLGLGGLFLRRRK